MVTHPQSPPPEFTPRAAVLAIGTELTQGQITNRNATWISERLTARGITVVHHAVVPDDHALVSTALDFAAAHADLVFVTGGLGPTTDDFTRDCLAEWSKRPLEFREASWRKITTLLKSRGIEVAPSNRIQCFFPKDSTVLENHEGTADGFRFAHGTSYRPTEVQVFALPGPPREGMHLWETTIDPWLGETYGALTPPRLESWSCLGKSESSLGEIVETAVAGFGVKTGYRASPPYVEVKIWIPEGFERGRELALLAKLNAELAPYSVARNGEDLAEKLLAVIESVLPRLPADRPVTFLDLGTEGALTERLLTAFKTPRGRKLQPHLEILTRYENSATSAGFAEKSAELFLGLFAGGEVAVIGPAGKAIRSLPTPYTTPALADRLRRYRTEMALKTWAEILGATFLDTVPDRTETIDPSES